MSYKVGNGYDGSLRLTYEDDEPSKKSHRAKRPKRERGSIDPYCLVLNILFFIVYAAILTVGLLAYYGTDGNVFAVLTGVKKDVAEISEGYIPLLEQAYGMLMLSLMPTALMAIVATRLPFRLPPWVRMLLVLAALGVAIWLTTLYLPIIDQIQFPKKDHWVYMAVFYGSPYVALAFIAVPAFLGVLLARFSDIFMLFRLILTCALSIPLLFVSIFVYILVVIAIILLIWYFFATRPESSGTGRIYIFYYDD